jgi:YfiH family protein
MRITIFQASHQSGSPPQTVPGVLQVAAWRALPWLRHGFSTRAGGVSTVYNSAQPASDQSAAELNLGWTADDSPENVAENRRRFTAAVFGADPAALTPPPALVTVRQVHSARSLVVPDQTAALEFATANGRAVFEADGLLTRAPGVLLGIQTADCVPVLVVDPTHRAVAAFHAGWRGTAARIVEQGIAQMAREFGSRPEELLAAVGPSIGPCCYTVGSQVLTGFHAAFDYADALFAPVETSNPPPTSASESAPEAVPDPDQDQRRLDLWQANQRQLLAAGIPAANLTVFAECTACAGLPERRRYFSHRAEHGFTGRMLSAIGLA